MVKIRHPLMAALALAAVLAPVAQAQAAERWLFNCFFPPQHYACTQMVAELRTRIETATEKRVRVSTPPKSLAAPPDQYDGVVNGVMDGALQFNQFIANKVAGAQLAQLPFVGIEGAEAASVALWETYEKFFADKNEYGPVKLLSFYVSNGAEFYSTNDTPIKTVEDIGGRKMWALPGVTANLVKETGSPVVAGPAVQMLEIISKGVTDGYVGVPISSVLEFKLTDYTRSATAFKRKVFQPSFSFFVSKGKWDAISKADQDAIMKVMGVDFARFAGKVQDGFQRDAKSAIKAAGITVHEGSDDTLARLEALGKPAIDAWVERVGKMGVDGREAIKFYQSVLARESKAAAK
ncbi:MAG: TRAP transporter substrate-binding protein DctP [Burkholderiaceae bacterium]